MDPPRRHAPLQRAQQRDDHPARRPGRRPAHRRRQQDRAHPGRAGPGLRADRAPDGPLPAGPADRRRLPGRRRPPARHPAPRARADDPEPGTLTLAWVDDLAHLSWRLVRPNPSAGVDQQTASHYELTDDAETVIRALVDLNLGPSALEERRVPGLVLGDVAGVG